MAATAEDTAATAGLAAVTVAIDAIDFADVRSVQVLTSVQH